MAERPEKAEKARPRRNWVQEERRTILGHWVAFCVSCGHTSRYFEEFECELPAACPHCAGPIVHRCGGCGARFPSAFQVRCEECDGEIRPPELFGGPIRKPGR